jgi:glycosyltransferase involved in cell wall biosynthesis
MTKSGVVSVITIFLDEVRFLEDAIRSVVAQTYPNWELLLVDDGSTDGSSAVARSYAARYPDRIRYLHHPQHQNRGMSASRNLGIEHARGEFIALVDADDTWLPQKLERQVAVLASHPDVGMVFGPTLSWYSWAPESDPSERDAVTKLPSGKVPTPGGQRVLARILAGRGAPIHTCSMLARRQAVVDIGGFEDQFRGLFEDQAFFAKMLLGYPVYVMREPLDRYRQHPDSHCAVATRDGGMASAEMLEARRRYLRWLNSRLTGTKPSRGLAWRVRYELWLHEYSALARARHSIQQTMRTAYGRGMMGAFALARRVVPVRLRERIWRRAKRFSADAEGTPGVTRNDGHLKGSS